MNRLPDKPSELLMASMEDFFIIKDNPRYLIEMSTWCRKQGEVCYVCQAGATIANRLGAFDPVTSPVNFDQDTWHKLAAINRFRLGDVHWGLCNMGIKSEAFDSRCHAGVPVRVSNYSSTKEDKQDYENWMLSLIGILQAEGL